MGLSNGMSSCLPPTVMLEEAWDDDGVGADDAESPIIERAVPARRREFRTGRACARKGLARLGLPPVSIGKDLAGAPVWPQGVVGSITHCTGYRAAAVARLGSIKGIGIDAERRDAVLEDGTLDLVLLPEEREWCDRMYNIQPGIPWYLLHFSAKESIYKLWYPLTQRWLGFKDVGLTFDSSLSAFAVARCTVAEGDVARILGGFVGRYVVSSNYVFTSATLSADFGIDC